MRVLVCGGRDFADRDSLFEVMDAAHSLRLVTEVVHGYARGADMQADEWGLVRHVPVIYYPADWRRWGKSAGAFRNAKMLRERRPEIVIAFPGGRGTLDMIKKAKAAGVPVIDLGQVERGSWLQKVGCELST